MDEVCQQTRIKVGQLTDSQRQQTDVRKLTEMALDSEVQTERSYKATYRWREDQPVDLPVATGLALLESNGEVVGRCLKGTEHLMKLCDVSAIDIYTEVDEDKVNDHLLGQEVKRS